MAEQRIVFEQGDTVTGDSGERGDSTLADGGVESVKPIDDGERAVQAVFNRPVENIRKRTEELRDAGEQQLYLQDSDMRWIIAPGDGTGVGTGLPLPTVWWDEDLAGVDAGVFITVGEIVVQPINTPATDVQETVDYSFTDTFPNTANVSFNPILTKRAYNGANLIRIIWEAVDPLDLSGATEPDYCNIAITGDIKHIITISIRDDLATQMTHVLNALGDATVIADLATMGLEHSNGGTDSTYLYISEVTTLDYTMVENFEREIHRIAPATFASFFSGGPYLGDGDTLAISYDYFVDPGGVTGRRQSCPYNTGTSGVVDVLEGQLFITSTDTDEIPLCIPLCKRVGDDLFWLDGTINKGGMSQAEGSIEFGENGYTVDRVVNGPATMRFAAYNVPGLSDLVSELTTAVIQTNIENLVDDVNTKGSLGEAETVTGIWTFSNGVNADQIGLRLGIESDYWMINMTDTSLSMASTTNGGINSHIVFDEIPGSGREAFFTKSVLQVNTTDTTSAEVTGIYSWVNVIDGWASPLMGLHSQVTVGSVASVGYAYGAYLEVHTTTGASIGATDLIGLQVEMGTDQLPSSTGRVKAISIANSASAGNLHYSLYCDDSDAVMYHQGPVAVGPVDYNTKDVVGELFKVGNTTDAAVMNIDTYSSGPTVESVLQLRRSKSNSAGVSGYTPVADLLGSVQFFGISINPASFQLSAQIASKVSNVATNTIGGRLILAGSTDSVANVNQLVCASYLSCVGVNIDVDEQRTAGSTVTGTALTMGGAISFPAVAGGMHEESITGTNQSVDVGNHTAIGLLQSADTDSIQNFTNPKDGQIIIVFNKEVSETLDIVTGGNIEVGVVIPARTGVLFIYLATYTNWFPCGTI